MQIFAQTVKYMSTRNEVKKHFALVTLKCVKLRKILTPYQRDVAPESCEILHL